jgi:hypothetical protein
MEPPKLKMTGNPVLRWGSWSFKLLGIQRGFRAKLREILFGFKEVFSF